MRIFYFYLHGTHGGDSLGSLLPKWRRQAYRQAAFLCREHGTCDGSIQPITPFPLIGVVAQTSWFQFLPLILSVAFSALAEHRTFSHGVTPLTSVYHDPR